MDENKESGSGSDSTPAERPRVVENDIVQLDPEKTENAAFAGCLMTVTKVREWGVQGYVQNAGTEGQAHYRAAWGTFETTGGQAVWSVGEED